MHVLLEDQIKLELHRAVVDHLHRDPDGVRQTALRNLALARERRPRNDWGRSGDIWLDEWEDLLRGPLGAL
ncbi:MAG: hypothetical protein FWD11_04760, partial [Micrococcales bacterium]|nr:hypothetical protein [Micrococcales bacterium]